MTNIYLAFVDTPGLFASIIRKVIKQKYIHVVLSMDEKLDEAYSIGRRNPAVPLLAGFEREDKKKILFSFPTADYMVCSLSCTDEQKEYIQKELAQAYENRFHYHYTILGLPFILFNRPFYQKNHYTCSSYLAKILEDAGVCHFDKHFSLVTPKDFYQMEEKEQVFEGSLYELVDEREVALPQLEYVRTQGVKAKVAYEQ